MPPLEDAIAEQIEKLEEAETEVEENPSTESDDEEETSEEGDDVTDEDDKDFEDPAVLKEAKNLYKLLKDKDTRSLVLETLARKEGILKDNPIETKKDVTEARKDIKSILKEKLGEKFDFLIPQLGDALDEILNQIRDENKASVSQVQQTVDRAQLESQITSAMNVLSKETKGESVKYEKKMAELSQKFPSSPGLTAIEYLRGLYLMAGGRVSESKQSTERVNRNAKDLPSRLKTSSGAGPESPRNLPKMNINQSINHALKTLKLDK